MTKLRVEIVLPVVAMALLCPGCTTYQLTPHVAGWVVDQSTRMPLPNATVYFEAFPQDVALSGYGGRFDLLAIQQTKFLSHGPKEDVAMSQSLVVKADGFGTDEIEFAWTGRQAPAETNKVIYLQPK